MTRHIHYRVLAEKIKPPPHPRKKRKKRERIRSTVQSTNPFHPIPFNFVLRAITNQRWKRKEEREEKGIDSN
jgi:hypothetical protein